MKQLITLLTLILVLVSYGCETNEIRPEEKPYQAEIDSLMELMTLEEKVGQLNLLSSGFTETGPVLAEDYKEMIAEGQMGGIFNGFTVEHTRELQEIAVEETRLGIPLIFGFDVIHGYRTIFPIPLGETATWEPDLIKKASKVAAEEAAAGGVHWTFAPMLDVSPDPRWGRIAESAGEDPLMNSLFGKARVKGFQGDDLKDLNTLLATAKHFIGYGDAEGGRDYNTVDISERTLRERHLPPFIAAMDAGVGTVMTAFNEYDGVPATGSQFLLNQLLRDELEFDGFVVTDYTSIPEMIQHGVAANEADAVELAMNANVDMDMQSIDYVEELPGLIEEGRISEEQVDQAVERILRKKFKLGLFEDPYRYSDPQREEETILREDFKELALEVSKRSIVLMKNENQTLPLDREELNEVAVIGPLGDNQYDILGSWSAAGQQEDNITLLEGIENNVAEHTNVTFTEGATLEFDDTSRDGFAEAIANAEQADVAIVVVGEDRHASGEAASRSSIDLPGMQQELLQEIHATGTPVVMVLMSGRPMAINWAEDNVPAILNAWYLGTMTGEAISEVMFGDYNPAGKIPVTYPRNAGMSPYYYNHKNTGRPMDPDERYTSKYIDVENSPLYPFGYGLSYTTFDYDNLMLSDDRMSSNGNLEVSVDVTNTGDQTGEEVVQLYTRQMVASVTRPVKQLRNFDKIELEPGETRTVNFDLGAEQLYYYNKDMEYGIEPSEIRVFVGGDSEDVLEDSFYIE